MSSSIVLWPIIKALCMASQFIGLDPAGWQSVNQKQQNFLENHFIKRDEVSAFADKELQAWASNDYEYLNAILKNEGFGIQLSPFDKDSFGVVSILDVNFQWLHKGDETTIVYKNTSYPAVRMDSGFKVFSAENYTQPIVCLETKSNDKVWMTIADHDTPLQDFELLQWIESVQKNRVQSKKDYDIVKFPMVDLDQEVNVTWLVDMTLPGWFIAEALQQTKFKMNNVGAHVKSGFAMSMCRSSGREPIPRVLTIDQPFYLWIERSGVTVPVFAGYITQQDWKKPENLEFKDDPEDDDDFDHLFGD